MTKRGFLKKTIADTDFQLLLKKIAQKRSKIISSKKKVSSFSSLD